MTDIIATQSQFELPLYPMRDIALVRGEGSKVWDSNGQEYLDCTSGNGVANVGHCNPAVVAAIKAQAEKLITCAGAFYNDRRAELLELLVRVSPDGLSRAFLCSSGTESVEAAIKFARYSTGKSEIISAMRGFHGRTFGALSATFNPKYKDDFAPLVPGFHHVPYNNLEKLSEKLTDNTAAVILEVIQGEGGVNIGEREYLQGVEKLCREKGVLFILDEVQTGFCRSGKMFASEHHDLTPDMLCLAKAIAGGLPMGAVLCSDRIKIDRGKHGTTFGGNPLSCAASIAAISFMLDQSLASQTAEKSAYLIEKLGAIESERIREVRGMGLMIGIELKEKSTPFLKALMERGVLALPAGPTVIRLLPPLTVSNGELDLVVAALGDLL